MDRRAEETIKILTDPNYAAAYPEWMLGPGKGADDFVRNGYAPRGTDLRDFGVVRREDVFHLFFTDFRVNASSKTAHQGTILGHVSTCDLIDWEVHPVALQVDPGHWDGYHAWSPNVFEWKGVYHLFYTGQIETLSQAIGFATSTDLVTWTRYPGNPVLHPGFFDWSIWSRTHQSDCRDPHVMRLGDEFVLYYTALKNDGEPCVAAAKSPNLVDWEDCGSVYSFLPTPPVSPLALESSCVHERGDGYVLFFSHNYGTNYVLGDDPLHFPREPYKVAWPNHLGIELVARKGDRWLVSAFRQAKQNRPARLYFGILDWSKPEPAVEIVPDRGTMRVLHAEFGIG